MGPNSEDKCLYKKPKRKRRPGGDGGRGCCAPATMKAKTCQKQPDKGEIILYSLHSECSPGDILRSDAGLQNCKTIKFHCFDPTLVTAALGIQTMTNPVHWHLKTLAASARYSQGLHAVPCPPRRSCRPLQQSPHSPPCLQPGPLHTNPHLCQTSGRTSNNSHQTLTLSYLKLTCSVRGWQPSRGHWENRTLRMTCEDSQHLAPPRLLHFLSAMTNALSSLFSIQG